MEHLVRAVLMVVMIAGLVLSPVDLEAKKGKGRKKTPQLVNRVLVGAEWQVETIPVINRSSYDRASIEYAAQLWASTSAPRLSVQHASPTQCSDVKPVPNTIILCDAVPWNRFSITGVAGFTANYTQSKSRGKQVVDPAIQATVIWFYPPQWSNPKILRYIPSHELGHALGLGEMACTCVMTPIVSDIDRLGAQERAAIDALYS